MEFTTITLVLALFTLAMVAGNRARHYKALALQTAEKLVECANLGEQFYWANVVMRNKLEAAEKELQAIKLTHSKLQLLDYADKPVDGE